MLHAHCNPPHSATPAYGTVASSMAEDVSQYSHDQGHGQGHMGLAWAAVTRSPERNVNKRGASWAQICTASRMSPVGGEQYTGVAGEQAQLARVPVTECLEGESTSESSATLGGC